MDFDDLTRTALIRGAIAFAVVLVVGSTAVFTSGHLRASSGVQPSTTPVSPSPVQPAATGTPEAWLAWVPGGLPDGFGSSITAIPAIGATTTATADIAWLTGSSDARGRPVDQPVAPFMIPIDTTGVEPGFASFLPQPERRLVAGLDPRQGILSESEAKLRHLGVGKGRVTTERVPEVVVVRPRLEGADHERVVTPVSGDASIRGELLVQADEAAARAAEAGDRLGERLGDTLGEVAGGKGLDFARSDISARRLFGTFVDEGKVPLTEFGLEGGRGGATNPVTVAFEEWRNLLSDLRASIAMPMVTGGRLPSMSSKPSVI